MPIFKEAPKADPFAKTEATPVTSPSVTPSVKP
jgi:hypothetical protein